MSTLSDKALQIAISQIGQDEKPHGSNWGEPVKTYLASVGITFPAAWCYSFIYWCFNEAAKELKVFNPLVHTGGVLHAWNADTQFKFHDPQIGDIFIMDLHGGLGHTGIIESIDGNKLHTIEGNTNNNGSREGIAVERKLRINKLPIIGYLRY